MSMDVLFKNVTVVPSKAGLTLEFESERQRDSFLKRAFPVREETTVTRMFKTPDGVYLGIFTSAHVTIFHRGGN